MLWNPRQMSPAPWQNWSIVWSLSSPEVPLDSVRAIVNASWEEFTGRPIRDFVPVLAERTARHRLSSKTSAG
jgi:hypothetical protein